MEATMTNGIEYTYNRNEIDEKIVKTIETIEKVIKENNYRVTGTKEDFEEYSMLEYKNFSKNQMKNIQKYCFWVQRKPTLRRINSFFSLLSRLFEVKRVTVKVSLKEEKIQNARKEWLKVRNEADKLLTIYKEEKSDFYKKGLVVK